jgi:hypothetical protein
MSAEDYVVKNTDQQALQAYLVIFRSLPEEFKERRYVLICAGLPLLLDDRYSISLAAAMQICSGIYKPKTSLLQ